MSITQHTPTPFSLPLEIVETREGPSIRDAQGGRVAECYFMKDAEDIKRAVNNHAAPVAAVERLTTFCQNLMLGNYATSEVVPLCTKHIHCNRAALAAAKE